MRKTDKKIENSIVSALTKACEDDLKAHEGFVWITHIVEYSSFPQSLTIVCVFETNDRLHRAIERDSTEEMKTAIETRLLSQGIKIKDIKRRIVFDTEEACDDEHKGNWSKRLNGVGHARHV